METKKRIVGFDVVRTIAILCVVLCHSTEMFYSFTQTGWNNVSIPLRVFSTSIFIIGRLGVPLFLFLSGALILKKHIETDEDILSFYKKNLLPLIIVHIIWTIIYNVFLFAYESSFSLSNFLKELFFLKQSGFLNMWYIPMIIGIYIGLPFVAMIIKTFSKKVIKVAAISIFILTYIVPMVLVILSMLNINGNIETTIAVPFFGGMYGLYTIIGYYLSNKKKSNKGALLFVACISYLIVLGFQLLSYSKYSNQAYNVWYDFPFLLICASCIFKLLIDIDYSSEKKYRLITFISKTSLGTFFIHVLTITVLKPYIEVLEINTALKILTIFVFSFIICLIINFLITRIKIISKYLILIKN